MKEYRIVNRGDGPKIEGTRITVYQVLEYVQNGHSREWIASVLDLSSRQVQAALDYIREHETEVNAQYEKIIGRIRQGNPAWVERRLEANRAKLQARLAQHRDKASGVGQHATHHVGQ